jgi:hypothetical protein
MNFPPNNREVELRNRRMLQAHCTPTHAHISQAVCSYLPIEKVDLEVVIQTELRNVLCILHINSLQTLQNLSQQMYQPSHTTKYEYVELVMGKYFVS